MLIDLMDDLEGFTFGHNVLKNSAFNIERLKCVCMCVCIRAYVCMIAFLGACLFSNKFTSLFNCPPFFCFSIFTYVH